MISQGVLSGLALSQFYPQTLSTKEPSLMPTPRSDTPHLETCWRPLQPGVAWDQVLGHENTDKNDVYLLRVP